MAHRAPSNMAYNPAAFRQRILEAIPELGPRYANTKPHSHLDARALHDFALDAIVAGDAARVIRVFRLARELAALGGELDVYSENALSTEFLYRVGPHERETLAIFRQIPEDVRRTLHCPVTFPHTWFEPAVLDLARGNAQVCAPIIDAEARARYVRQASSVDTFADVTLRIEPNAGGQQVVFASALPNDLDFPLSAVEIIRDTVRVQLQEMRDAGRCLHAAVITLIRAQYHFADSHQRGFEQVTREALAKVLQESGAME